MQKEIRETDLWEVQTTVQETKNLLFLAYEHLTQESDEFSTGTHCFLARLPMFIAVVGAAISNLNTMDEEIEATIQEKNKEMQ